jgi:hypothetical protein
MIKKQQKWIALLVAFTFMWLLQVSTMPLGAANTTEQLSSANDEQGPRFVEEEGDSGYQAKKKGSVLPYILIGVAVAAGITIAIILLTKKPSYTLTVSLGTGCTGTPLVLGTHKKGTVVPYSYTPLAGYVDVKVLLDGIAVPASGTITMDKNKTLAVSAEALDIRGSWTMPFVATNVVKNFTWTMVFSGSLTSGSIKFFDWTGTYTVTGNNVAMNFSLYHANDLVMAGSFTGKNAMAGTAVLTSLWVGGIHVTGANWTATRTAATTSSAGPKPTTETTLGK